MHPSCRPTSRHEAGVSLVEVMIAVVITVGLSAAAFSYLTNVEDHRHMMTRVTTRDAIAKRIESQLASFRNIQFSGLANAAASPGNALLRDCLDAGGGGCTVKGSANQTPFKFFVNQGAAGAILLAGTEAEPVAYDYNGRPDCTVGEAGCPAYEVSSYFWATCPAPPEPCGRATQVSVRFQIKGLKPLRNGKAIPNYPPDDAFKKKSAFALHHVVRDVPSSSVDEVCPSGSFQTGSHPNGKIKSSCAFNTQPVGIDPVTKNPTACTPSAVQCPKDHVINGIKNDGKPWCCKITTTCSWKNFPKDTDAGCSPGSWIEELNMGYCSDKLGSGGGAKSGPTPIGCDVNKGYCCSYKVGACT